MHELKEVCRAYQPVVVFLMETRAPRGRVDRIRRTLKFKFYYCVEPRGLSGGLCILWNPQVNVQVFESSPNFIHTFITDQRGDSSFECTYVYGNPIFHDRRNLWGKLAGLNRDRNFPWCCMGDFNEMVNQWEKDGIRPFDHARANLFRGFMNEAGLMDMNLKGNKFTWASNPRNGMVVREKIDRVMVNWAWRERFPHAFALALPIISLDHSPIVVQTYLDERSGVLFRYEAYWDDHPCCKEVVKSGWDEGGTNEYGWNSFLAKSKACKRRLQQWNKREFKRADVEIRRLKGELSDLLNRNADETDWTKIKEIQEQIKELWKREEMYWFQRSRVKWLNWGDRNSKFFHASTVQRRGRNRIVRLKNEVNEWVEGKANLFELILHHFQCLYTSEVSEISPEILLNIPSQVTAGMNQMLEARVTETEVKAAIEGLGSLKAPGPDGLNGAFFRNHWEAIKGEVLQAVLGFFDGERLLGEINETLVSLIPKVQMAESLNQLRPISCCNFIYKIISKIIVMRLKGIMGQLVSENQSAFVGGRLIQDNLIIAHEAFHALKRKDRGGKDYMAIKLDMNKAYAVWSGFFSTKSCWRMASPHLGFL